MAKAVTKTTGNSAKFLYSYNSLTLSLISHGDPGKRTFIQNLVKQKPRVVSASAVGNVLPVSGRPRPVARVVLESL